MRCSRGVYQYAIMGGMVWDMAGVRTIVWLVRGARSTTTAHHGHGLATAGAQGCRRKARPERLPALRKVLSGAFDFYGSVSQGALIVFWLGGRGAWSQEALRSQHGAQDTKYPGAGAATYHRTGR